MERFFFILNMRHLSKFVKLYSHVIDLETILRIKMRKRYSLINTVVGGSSKIASLFLGFFCRTVFIRKLGYDYLGINGLFSNILMLLSLSELGFGTSIIYLLYKADAEDDTYKQNCLLTFYARIYKIIGCFIILAGCVLTPMLPWFIKENSFAITYLKKVFIIQILNCAVSYFFSYRSSLIFVKQKDYLLKIISFICNFGCNITQIVLLSIHADYSGYLIIQLLFTLVNNIIVFMLSKKMYPEIKIGKEYQLSKDTYKELKNKVNAMLCHNISGFVTNGTDNIIISKFIGIIEVGLYSNYYMVISGMFGLLDTAMKGVTASLGNYMAQSSIEEVYKIYKKIDFIFYIINALCTTCLGVLFHQFITLWVGKESVFPRYVEFVLVANLYISIQRKGIFTIRDVGGLFSNDKMAAIAKPIINLTISLLLVHSMGIVGVFIGTLISGIVIDIFWMPYMVYIKYFQRNFLGYIVDYIKQCGIIVLSITGVSIILQVLDRNGQNIFQLFFNGIICCLITVIMILLFYKNELKMYVADVRNLIKRG